MRRHTAILSTTHRDLEGERNTRASLESMAREISEHYVPVGDRHDPRIPPSGRIVSAQVLPVANGHFAVQAELEFWDESDSDSRLIGDGRKLRNREIPQGLFAVSCDRAAILEHGSDVLSDLAQLGGQARPKYHAKKGIGVASSILIGFTVFALSAIGNGFLGQLGQDAYNALKTKLRKLRRRSPDGDFLLVLELTVAGDGSTVDVHLVLTNPIERDINRLDSVYMPELQRILSEVLSVHPRPARVVVEVKNDTLRACYTLRSDGVPNPRSIADDSKIMGGGLSMGGIVEIERDASEDDA